MFGGAEMSRGNLGGADQVRLVAVLTTFSNLVRDACLPLGLGPGQAPFARVGNFVAVLNPDAIHVVVDDVPTGGIPDHTYIDRRKDVPVLPLDAVVGLAVRELGFRNPLGVTLPLAAYVGDEAACRAILSPIAAQICTQLRERAVVQSLKLPTGYEHYARFMPAFLKDHPDVESNIFLIMRFRSGPQYDEIHKAIQKDMAQYGLKVLRADDKDYTGDLWENVCLYMLGSRFGVAVFEEIDLREFNPNIALELGFMMAQNKRCLILKDQRMPRLPTDIVGKLYREFDSYSIKTTIGKAINAWANDIGLMPNTSAPNKPKQ